MRMLRSAVTLAIVTAFPRLHAQTIDPPPLPPTTGSQPAATPARLAPATPATVAPEPLDDAVPAQPEVPKSNLPMTKEVVSGEGLRQTQEGYSDAIRNVAGVQETNSSGSANDAFSIRGIKLNLFSNYRLDGGLPVAGVITAPTEDKQRVETLKGANALMFGIASPAGIINFIPKRAGNRDVTSVTLAGNWFGQYGGTIDIGRRLGAQREVGVRVTASETQLDNGVRHLQGHGEFLGLGLDYRATRRLTLQADVEYYQRTVPEQAGISLLPVTNGQIPITTVPDPRNLLSGRWNEYTPRTTNVQLRADYVLTDAWKVLVQAGESDSHRHRNTVRIGGYDPDTGAGGVVTVQPITNDYRNRFGRIELQGHATTGSWSHDVTFGASRTQRYGVSYDLQTITLAQRQNIFDPILLDPPKIGPGKSNPAQTSTDTGLYTYDTVGVTARMKLLLGIRLVKDDEVNGGTMSTSRVNSPAAGILYDLRPTTTLFGSYMQGLEAGGTSPANAANPNIILAPAISRQKEIGVRDSSLSGFAFNASWFDITRANAVTDPITKIFDYSGQLSYKGVEATATYALGRDWKLHAAVLWLKARMSSPDQPLIDGKVPENTPTWNGNLGAAWHVPGVAGLYLKGDVKLLSSRPVDPQDQGYIPGYALYGAGASYETHVSGHRVSFAVIVDNLTNKRYWNSVQTGTYGIGMDRNIKFNMKLDL